MNQTLKRVNEEKVLFFDCEVVRRTKNLDINSREFKLFQKKIRDKGTDELLTDGEVVERYERQAALKMCYTKIVSIGVGFIKDGEVHIKAIDGEEGDIIQQFCTIASNFDFLCGANIIGYDLPMLVNNGYRTFDVCIILPDRFITSGKKPWNLDRIIDIMDIFKGTHYENNSLDEICEHFEVPSPKTDLDGSKVSNEYWSNGVERISKYVKQDVFASVNVFKKMRFESIFESFIDKNETKKESVEESFVEKSPILVRVYNKKGFSEEDREELETLLKSKEPTEEDKVNLKKIILAHYQAKTDKVAVKKAKELEVGEFVNSLYV
jgi:predicted PolB exonuclease-like 3'-5' exonuclease